MEMSVQELLNLFDSQWFGQEIEAQLYPESPQEQDPPLEIDQEPEKPNLSRFPTLHVISDQSPLFVSDRYSLSPTSVLAPVTGNLRTGEKGARIEKKLSKSLSELEREEVRGLVELGFVFSEEEEDSRLVSVVPGLRRFGGTRVVSRPYLSEAWEVMERERREKRPLVMNKIDWSNEMDVKDRLKCWAHSVACSAL